MKLIYLSILFLGTINCFAQSLIWKSNLTGINNNYGTKSAIDSQNNIYVVGAFNGTCNAPTTLTTNGNDDGLILKYDQNGTLIWAKKIGGSYNDYALDVVISPDDEYIYVIGTFIDVAYADGYSLNSNSTTGTDGFLAKYKKNGDIIYFKKVAYGSNTQRIQGIKIDKNNNLLLAGIFLNNVILGDMLNNLTLTTTQPIGMFVAKFDTSGVVLSAKMFESNNATSRLYTFDVDTSGYYFVGHFKNNLILDLGTYSSNNNSLDMFVYKLDFNLNSKWIIKVAGSGDEHTFSCATDKAGFFYFGGHFTSQYISVDSTTTGLLSNKIAANKITNGTSDVFFAKYRYDGVLQWFNTLGSKGNDYLYRGSWKDNNFIVAGTYLDTLSYKGHTIYPKGDKDAFVLVQNHNNNLIHLVSVAGQGTEVGETSLGDSDGNFIFIGDFTSDKVYFLGDSITNSNQGTKDMFLLKFN